MKGMKKLLCVLLTGTMVMSLCACGSKGSGKSRRDRDDDDDDDRDQRVEQTDEEETTVKYNPEDEYWFVDPTDEAAMRHFVDCMFTWYLLIWIFVYKCLIHSYTTIHVIIFIFTKYLLYQFNYILIFPRLIFIY